MTLVDVQVNPAVMEWPAVRDAALAAEAAGFGAFHVFDHLAGAALGGTTMIECFSLLGALSEATTTIELGSMVANVWNRAPGTLVSAAASIVHLSGRPFHFGLGAGSSPTSGWAAEQHAAGHHVDHDVVVRHQRVADVLVLAAAEWSVDRPDALSTFPLPSPVPITLVGCNSVALADLAGRLAGGINVPWNHPRRPEILQAATSAAGSRPFVTTAYHVYDRDLLDATHPKRAEMSQWGIDRLVLAEFGSSPSFPSSV
ncbi:MAG: LLM class flavin-dependent oxidoreductase [Ilumatobacteraceae bacterium]